MNSQKLKRIIIKEELVALTGSIDGAIVLNQMVYWSERVQDFDGFMKEENKRAKNEGYEQSEYTSGWIYKTADELTEELMNFKSPKTLSRILDNLVTKGWLDRRTNPKYRWDKTYQYRINLIKIQSDLSELGYHLDGYKAQDTAFVNLSTRKNNMSLREDNLSLRENNMSDRKGHGVGAIPETTTENINVVVEAKVPKMFFEVIGQELPEELVKEFLVYSPKEIQTVFTTLKEKKNLGKIKNPVGILLKDAPSVIKCILRGEFYPDIHDDEMGEFTKHTGILIKGQYQRDFYQAWREKFSKEMMFKAGELTATHSKNGSLEYMAAILKDWEKRKVTAPKDINRKKSDYETYYPPDDVKCISWS